MTKSRTLPIAIAILTITANSAQGGAIQFNQLSRNTQSTTDTPRTARLRVGVPGTDRRDWQALEIPGIGPDERERIIQYDYDDGLGRLWTITEENASEYGFDWNAFEQELIGPYESKRLTFSFSDQPVGAGPLFGNDFLNPGEELVEFNMERIEIYVDYWFWHPIFSALRDYRVEARIIGNGVIIPEPATGVLGLLGLCGLVCRRHRKPIAQDAS